MDIQQSTDAEKSLHDSAMSTTCDSNKADSNKTRHHTDDHQLTTNRSSLETAQSASYHDHTKNEPVEAELRPVEDTSGIPKAGLPMESGVGLGVEVGQNDHSFSVDRAPDALIQPAHRGLAAASTLQNPTSQRMGHERTFLNGRRDTRQPSVQEQQLYIQRLEHQTEQRRQALLAARGSIGRAQAQPMAKSTLEQESCSPPGQDEERDGPEKDSDNEDGMPWMSRYRETPSLPRQSSTGTSPQSTTAKPCSLPASPTLELSFALPRYAVTPHPASPRTPFARAKISLPGLVREELLLSPDHSAQELHLLVHLFLPSQQSLATPDPEPARAVLNFHTISLMVVEAFTQFEIGDEFGMGRGHWHTAHDEDAEAEYARVRSATDASVDDIFFAVMDRWRAGRESGRKGLELIRGVQEFCDVALDVVFWVKEHGLVREREAGDAGEEAAEQGKPKKRGAQKANEMPSRKKAKTAPAGKPKPKPKPKLKTASTSASGKPKPRPKAKSAGVVVVKKARD